MSLCVLIKQKKKKQPAPSIGILKFIWLINNALMSKDLLIFSSPSLVFLQLLHISTYGMKKEKKRKNRGTVRVVSSWWVAVFKNNKTKYCVLIFFLSLYLQLIYVFDFVLFAYPSSSSNDGINKFNALFLIVDLCVSEFKLNWKFKLVTLKCKAHKK